MASAFQGCEIGNTSVTFVALVTSCRSKDDDGCAPRSLKFYVDIVILAIAMAKMFRSLEMEEVDICNASLNSIRAVTRFPDRGEVPRGDEADGNLLMENDGEEEEEEERRRRRK